MLTLANSIIKNIAKKYADRLNASEFEKTGIYLTSNDTGTIELQINGINFSQSEIESLTDLYRGWLDISRVYVVCQGGFSYKQTDFFLECSVRDKNGIAFDPPDRIKKIVNELKYEVSMLVEPNIKIQSILLHPIRRVVRSSGLADSAHPI